MYHAVMREAITAQDTASKTMVDVGCCMGTNIRKPIVDGFVTKACVTLCLNSALRLIKIEHPGPRY